jgi:hypothetical protein
MSDPNHPLLDLGKLSEPATKLIECVSGALGVLYEPTAVRRLAKAEADALLIKAQGELEVQELAARASQRVTNRELRRQENIENVVRGSIQHLPETVSDAPVDEDWITDFFGFCQDVGNETMQSLWSRILSGEVARPNSYGLRTLTAVKMLAQPDAELFTAIAGRMCLVFGTPTLVYTVETMRYLASRGIHESALLHLDAVGLLLTRTGYALSFSSGDPVDIMFAGRTYRLTPGEQYYREGFKHLSPANVRTLTQVGMELFPLCEAEADEEYLQVLLDSIAEESIGVTELKD